MEVKNLATVPVEEQRDFLGSFDHVLSDMDGVIWFQYQPIPGAVACTNSLKDIGKKLTYITNNAISNVSLTKSFLVKHKFNTDAEVLNPTEAIKWHLNRIKFDKVIYPIAGVPLKTNMQEAGFKLAPDPPPTMTESVAEYLEEIKDDETIGAVLYEFDVNTTRIKLQKALTYLQRKDCLFIVGATYDILALGEDTKVIGNGHFYRLLRDFSGRNGLQLAKPSAHFNEFVVEKLKIEDPKRVLFIGDTITDDMLFASVGGYQKLLVLSGIANMEDLENWNYPEASKPKYYVNSMDTLNSIIKNVSQVAHL